MADKKVYQIQINGIKESVNAIESLNKVLDELDKRIKELEKKNINVNTNTNAGGGTSQTHTTVTSEEEKLAQQIAAIDAKREAYSKEIYQNYLAAKDVLDETLKDQKAIAAAERVQSNTYGNTIAGMKSKLADLKSLRETTDVTSDEFKKINTEIASLTKQLNELDAETKASANGMGKIKVMVGSVAREYTNYRQAIKELKAERFELSQTLGQEAKEYKEIDEAVKKLESDYNDLNKSSAFMDNLLDTMQSFTALASVGQGLSALFGIDNDEIQKSIQKLVALQNVLKGIETIQLQMQRKEGLGKWLEKGSSGVDAFVSKITGAQRGVDGLTMATKRGTMAVRGFSMALKGIGIGLIIAAITTLLNSVEKLGEALDTTSKKAKLNEEALKSINKIYEERKQMLTSSYLNGTISSEQLLSSTYKTESELLSDQISLLQQRAKILNEGGTWDKIYDFLDRPFDWSGTKGTEFTGKKMTVPTTVGSGKWGVLPPLTQDYDLQITVNSIKEVEEAIEKCTKALEQGKDYYSMWGKGIGDFYQSLWASTNDTEKVLEGLKKIRLSDFIGNYQEVNDKFKEGKITAEEFAKEIGRLKEEFSSNKILQSVIVNLDQYIPDEKTKEAINNIITELHRLDDTFNMTSPEQIRHWAQVRIDAMKEGLTKTRAQIKLEEEYEIAQYGKTQEQIDMIRAKYARKRQEAEEKDAKERQKKAEDASKKLHDAQVDLENTRIQAMQESWEKQEAMLEQERKERLYKVKQEGILVGERTLAINALYDKKILDAKKKWAREMLEVYRNLRDSIKQMNEQTYNTEVSTASQNVENRATQQKQNVGMQTITPTNFDDSKTLEEYYKKVLEIEEEAAHRLAEINKEKLLNDLAYNKQEEELRHQNVVDAKNGELIKQYEAGKITKKQYDELIEAENAAHYARMNALDDEYAANLEKTTQNELQTVQNQYSQYYSEILNQVDKDKQKVDAVMSKQPKTDKAGWGVVMAVSVKKQYREALKEYEDLQNQIKQKQRELEADLKAGRISPEDFAMRQSELKREVEAIDNAVQQVKEKQKMLVADFVQSIQMYIDEAVNSFQTIMQALWDAEDARFDKEQEQIDKENDMLDKKLDEQQQLVEQHKSKIDSLEDELANSRGSRRQHLIDQINAEMAAERAAAKQQQKLQKDKEKQQAKQDALDKKRKKAQYKRDMLQAIVNGAMAVTFAAMNAWPVPAIPMMALAAATTAAEIAIMAANKPYAKGGQLEGGQIVGNRHRDGGVKVLGGRAEVEGGEYITNRITTQKNIDILDYINGKHKRLTLDDFVDFYGGSKVRNSIISSTPKRMFEEGGVLPTLRNDYDINDSMLSALEYYNNRPVVVSVVDIIDKEVDVKRVQTLAGL